MNNVANFINQIRSFQLDCVNGLVDGEFLISEDKLLKRGTTFAFEKIKTYTSFAETYNSYDEILNLNKYYKLALNEMFNLTIDQITSTHKYIEQLVRDFEDIITNLEDRKKVMQSKDLFLEIMRPLLIDVPLYIPSPSFLLQLRSSLKTRLELLKKFLKEIELITSSKGLNLKKDKDETGSNHDDDKETFQEKVSEQIKQETLIPLDEICRKFNISTVTLRALRKKYKLKERSIGRRVYIPESELTKIIKDRY